MCIVDTAANKGVYKSTSQYYCVYTAAHKGSTGNFRLYKFILGIANRIKAISHEPKTRVYLLQRTSVVIQPGNAAAVVGLGLVASVQCFL